MAAELEGLKEGGNLEELVALTVESSEARKSYGSNPETWAIISEMLKSGHDRILLYKLITNIAACDQAGPLAVDSGVLNQLVAIAGHDVTPSLWRALSNLNQTSPSDLSTANIDYGKALTVVTLPTLRLIAANVRKFPNSSVAYATNGVLMAVLSQVNDWYENDHDAFQITTMIFTSAIEAGMAPSILDDVVGVGMPGRSAALQKVVDAALSLCHQRLSEPVAHDLAMVLAKHLKIVIPAILPYFTNVQGRQSQAVADLWAWLLAIIESLMLVAFAARVELGAEDLNLTQKVVEVLIAAKSLPQHNKLGDGKHELDPSDFPLIRSTAIPLLSVLVAQNRWAQDYCRESGGLLAVLEACTVDENNPFVREKAIVCIRYLLQDNDENQKVVAQLEAKKVVNPDVLEKAGYEAEIKDGQLSVKAAKINELK